MRTIYDAKLLLVDDTPELLNLLCEHLRAAGISPLRRRKTVLRPVRPSNDSGPN